MGLTFTKQKEGVAGDLRYWSGAITFDSAYLTSGELVAAANFGWSSIYSIDLGMNGGLVFEWNKTTGAIMAFFPTGGATAAATTTAPVATTTIPAAGGVTVTSASANPTLTSVLVAGIGKEVASAVDLALIVVQVFAWGQ